MTGNRFDELAAARDQTEKLLRVIAEIGAGLDLDATLHRIISAARELTSAPYGALAVRDRHANLISFVHEGMDAETVRRIGHHPVGKGLLSLSLLDTPALRMDDLTAHPAAAGFPEHHPAMRAFLAVPITIRGAVFGNLYLTHVDEARVFSDADEMAARALAFAAAVAIDNAQVFERERMSVKWIEASREITTALLSRTEPHRRPMQLIAERACALTDAEQAIVLVPADPGEPGNPEVDTLVVSAAVGLPATAVLGQRVPVRGSTSGAVFKSGEPLITDEFRYPIQAFTDAGRRPAIVMPLRARDEVVGVIAIARGTEQPPFDESYLDLVRDFATHAAIALVLAAAREDARQLAVLAERERIAHDLHDHVIQRLFAAGMDLQGTLARARSPEVADRLNRTLDDLQTIIEEIRTTIFALRSPAAVAGDFRHRIQRVIAELTENRDLVTTVRMDGPMTAVGAELAEHAEAVTVEAVSNAVRHSGASRLTVQIGVADMFTLDVIDNGRGIASGNTRRSGLANMTRRAEQLGGSCEISSPPGGGTRVHWTAPLLDH
ncbi:GAF domain-containing sensor histidine kinase [Mycobacterium avium subsp. hominissuis]|uniref:sensor histidine kinase n=1 Tax=Mycobacterium avium TaxID=1764 RepID=UPI001CC77BF0|nr:GAF domain-containing sensor histidine kinase [Mycobacterium avium]MBZ4558765.1 GAF domain-containing sensor histidine kinase [Mycobacterium avium subsp. hominissuis]MBZ4568876.1 GAF domain-containing sensor histidine kinase [Mycobacterium avium subsp. hominissuis]MBZ4587331.1 GAF domain-containing sensor histidine kinase [Mycobacterium avium subsp. hominissuis]MBZ4624670.1 GAF domain-containing sensor histidine kinase [Mycobacterium avium subsp. hominissuis]